MRRARLQGLCRDLDRQVLISGTLLQGTELPPGITAEPMGSAELRGKTEPLPVFAISGRGS